MNIRILQDFGKNIFSKLFFHNKPFMKYREIRLISELLTNIKPQNALEFGSGYSTLYFNKLLKNKQIKTRWHSIESENDWFNYGLENKPDNVSILYEPNLDKYPLYPSKLKNSYDFILIDGRVRKRCILASIDYLADDGVIVLHDANRSYYYPKDLSMFEDQYLFLDARKNERMGDGGILLLAKKKGTIDRFLNIDKHKLEWDSLPHNLYLLIHS